jgi:hypothetical protein
MSTKDLIDVCMASLPERLPEGQMVAAFCSRCFQPECSRNATPKSFADRVQNWEERLFLNPSTLNPSDPRFKTIAGQKFQEVETSKPYNVQSDWSVVGENLVPLPPEVTPTQYLAPEEEPTAERPTGLPVNTPFQQGTMIGNTPATKAPPKEVDSWSGKVEVSPLPPSTLSLKPGGKFRFGEKS